MIRHLSNYNKHPEATRSGKEHMQPDRCQARKTHNQWGKTRNRCQARAKTAAGAKRGKTCDYCARSISAPIPSAGKRIQANFASNFSLDFILAQVDLCEVSGRPKSLPQQPQESYATNYLKPREKYVLIQMESKSEFVHFKWEFFGGSF